MSIAELSRFDTACRLCPMQRVGWALAMTGAEQFERAVAADIVRWGLLPPSSTVGVAVSGGADSVCLLLVLDALRPAFRWNLRVLHVNHHLRGAASDIDEGFVRQLAERLSLPVEVRRLDSELARLASGGPLLTGIEEWAREQRLRFFNELLQSGQIHRTATGHHRSDQAETVLFRLLRGAGSRGLGGMEPLTAGGIARPLLHHSRESIRQYLTWRKQDWREDASNEDLGFARNSLRHEWIPALSRTWNPRLEELLCSTAEQLREEAAFVEDCARREAGQLFRLGPYGWEAQVEAFRSLPVALQRRVILQMASQAVSQGAARDAASAERIPGLAGFAAVETVRELWSGAAGHGRYGTGRLLFERSGAWLRVVPVEVEAIRMANRIASVGNGLTIPAGETGCHQEGSSAAAVEFVYVAGSPTDSLILKEQKSGYTEAWSLLQSNQLHFPVTLRLWRKGDAIQLAGCASKRKIKHLFQRYGVPVWRRGDEWILESGGEVVWTGSFGVAAHVVPAAHGSGCLAIRKCPDHRQIDR